MIKKELAHGSQKTVYSRVDLKGKGKEKGIRDAKVHRSQAVFG